MQSLIDPQITSQPGNPISGQSTGESGDSGSADFFARILASNTGAMAERVKIADRVSGTGSGESPWSWPVGRLRGEINSHGLPLENLYVSRESSELLGNLMNMMGMDEQWTEQAMAESTNDDDLVSLDRMLDALERERLNRSGSDDPSIPGGYTPQVLSMVEKMGVSGESLQRLSSDLGQDKVSLRKLADKLENLEANSGRLQGEDLVEVRNLLKAAGLEDKAINKLLAKYLDENGGLNMRSLAGLLRDAADMKDLAVLTVRSGQIENLVDQLISESQIVLDHSNKSRVRSLKSVSLAEQLKALQSEKGNSPQIQELAQEVVKDPENKAQAALFKAALEARKAAVVSGSAGKPAQAEGTLDLTKAKAVRSDLVGKVKGSSKATAALAKTASQPSVQTNNPAKPVDQVSIGALKGNNNLTAKTTSSAQSVPLRAQPSVLLEQLSGRITMMIKSGMPSMRLQLSPPSMGSLRIDLQVDGQTVRATIVAENSQVQQILGSNANDLKQSLAQQGFNLEKFDVFTQGENRQANADSNENQQNDGGGRNQSGQLEETVPETLTGRARNIGLGRLDLVA